MAVHKSKRAWLAELLGPEFRVVESTYEDGPPPRLRILRAEPRRFLWWSWTAWRLVGGILDEQPRQVYCTEPALAEVWADLLPAEYTVTLV